jgi:hypothetical protein
LIVEPGAAGHQDAASTMIIGMAWRMQAFIANLPYKLFFQGEIE